MADSLTKEVRSYIMSQIPSKNTRPELIVRKFLFNNGIRFRLHDPRYPGRPDLVLKKYRTMIFIHGCFWHGHNDCKYFKMPTSNIEYWKTKITTNIERDMNSVTQLEAMGYEVITIWECQLKKEKRQQTLENLIQRLFV
jgi:DNA mismatch endonuclease (patch repair protein)